MTAVSCRSRETLGGALRQALQQGPTAVQDKGPLLRSETIIVRGQGGPAQPSLIVMIGQVSDAFRSRFARWRESGDAGDGTRRDPSRLLRRYGNSSSAREKCGPTRIAPKSRRSEVSTR